MFSYRIDDELKLVLPSERNAEEIYRAVRENLEELKLWMPWVTDDYSIESARDFIKTNLIELAQNNTFAAAIALEEKVVGTIGLHHLDAANKSVQIGYWLDKQAQGKGLATKCCRVLINYAFDDLGLNRIQINCSVENVKSRKIPERLGFKLEGIHRQVEWLNNEFRDWAIYGLLAEEWKILNSK
jgi:ribosomal-protein-serine acetyltransferase